MICEKNLHGICTGRIENDGGEHGIRHRQSRTEAGPDYLPAWRRGSSDVVLPHEDRRDGAPAIDLIDGDSLCDLLKKHNLGVTTKMVEKVSIDPSWFAKI